VKIEAATPEATHPSPLTHQGGVAEQCGLDRKHIEASHVAARFSSVEHQHLQFVSGHIARIRHGAIVAERANAVQRKLWIHQGAGIHEADRSADIRDGASSLLHTQYVQYIFNTNRCE
jgi:hypothetical protein